MEPSQTPHPTPAPGSYLGNDGTFEYWQWGDNIYRNVIGQRGYMIDPVSAVALPEGEVGGIPSGARWEAYIHHLPYLQQTFVQENPRKRRRNPSEESDAVFEEFHGEPPSETLAITEQFHVHGHLAGLGELVMIQIRLMGGTKEGALATINAPDPQTAPTDQLVHVACNEAKNQMFLVGGDQDIDLASLGFRESFTVTHDGEDFDATDIKDHMILGEIQRLDYMTEKAFDKFETISYFHKIGEDTKVRPFLAYEPPSKHMSIYGGEYTIHAVGIVN